MPDGWRILPTYYEASNLPSVVAAVAVGSVAGWSAGRRLISRTGCTYARTLTTGVAVEGLDMVQRSGWRGLGGDGATAVRGS